MSASTAEEGTTRAVTALRAIIADLERAALLLDEGAADRALDEVRNAAQGLLLLVDALQKQTTRGGSAP